MRLINRFRTALRRFRPQSRPGALILIYHRVAEPTLDPFGLAVSPRHFAEHLEVLRARVRPVPLRQLEAGVRAGKPPRKAVVVTFDDGYADNLLSARPLLERADVPATVFIVTGSMGEGRYFWWDELGSVLLHPGTLPQRLRLDLHGECVCDMDIADASTYSKDDVRRHGRWTFAAGEPPTPRHQLFLALYQMIQSLPDDRPAQAVQALRAWAGESVSAGDREARALTVEELTRLGDGALVEIGAHTVHHPLLPALPTALQPYEISTSRRVLVEETPGASR